MVKIKIDNREIEVEAGVSVLEAAKGVGIRIPNLCWMKGRPANTSCLVCMVYLKDEDRFAPSCGVRVKEGMEVESETERVHQSRRAALELLLSEHGGDCLGPCHPVCPAWMDIPKMIREIKEGDVEEAIRTIKKDIPLPAVLGRICQAPCEKACRRKEKDSPVSICKLKQWAADQDNGYIPECAADRKERIAVIGGGPAGIAAAYFLRLKGFQCTVYDDQDKPGGKLQGLVPDEVLQKEISVVQKMGVKFRLGKEVLKEQLEPDYDGVLFAVKGGRMAIRSIAWGRKMAFDLAEEMTGEPGFEIKRPFTTRLGKLDRSELAFFPANDQERIDSELKTEDAQKEAARCLRCDCTAIEDCRLKQYGEEYNANPSRFKGRRRKVELQRGDKVLYNSGKCILCGLCVGKNLSFTGRGFNVKIKVPFSQELKAAPKVCPTGALTELP